MPARDDQCHAMNGFCSNTGLGRDWRLLHSAWSLTACLRTGNMLSKSKLKHNRVLHHDTFQKKKPRQRSLKPHIAFGLHGSSINKRLNSPLCPQNNASRACLLLRKPRARMRKSSCSPNYCGPDIYYPSSLSNSEKSSRKAQRFGFPNNGIATECSRCGR